MTAGRELRRVHRGVVGFGAAVSEERFLELAGSYLRELFSQIGLRLVGVKRRSVADRTYLVDDCFVYFWIRMADADGQHAAKGVEILLAFIVPNVKALAFHQSERLLVIGCDRGKKKLFMFANGFGLR